MSKNFNKVKQYYESNVWNISQVKRAVEKKWITEEEYVIITNQIYDIISEDD